jgi:hypothetical protein
VTGSSRETCDQCRFDSWAYTNEDVLGSLRTIVPWWELLTTRVDDDVLHTRPAPTTWSAIEYGQHVSNVLALHAFGLEWMLRDDNPQFPDVDVPPMSADASTTPLDEATAALGTAGDTYRALAQQVKGDAADRVATFADGSTTDAASLVRHTVHDALHHWRDVARGFVALGAGVSSPRGVVEQISASGGGVPKTAIPEARVGYRGVVGDKQKTRRHHGRVWQALCLMTAEGIERMQGEGHPIGFGSAGENFTIRGLDWSALRPGARVQIGEVVCELSVPALPCNNNARWFSDGDFMRMHHVQHPGETRWYASVMRDGMVRAGDEVVVEPV